MKSTSNPKENTMKTAVTSSYLRLAHRRPAQALAALAVLICFALAAGTASAAAGFPSVNAGTPTCNRAHTDLYGNATLSRISLGYPSYVAPWYVGDASENVAVQMTLQIWSGYNWNDFTVARPYRWTNINASGTSTFFGWLPLGTSDWRYGRVAEDFTGFPGTDLGQIPVNSYYRVKEKVGWYTSGQGEVVYSNYCYMDPQLYF